jgi:hypothetical protein
MKPDQTQLASSNYHGPQMGCNHMTTRCLGVYEASASPKG